MVCRSVEQQAVQRHRKPEWDTDRHRKKETEYGIGGKPDGATVDADGYIWNARFGGACLVRLTPYGGADAVIDLPISRSTSCASGGKNLDRLYITTATQGLGPAAQSNEPLAGPLLAIDVGIGA